MHDFLQILLGVIALLAGGAVVIGVLWGVIWSFSALFLSPSIGQKLAALIILPLAIALIVWGHDKPIPLTEGLWQQQEGQG